MAISNSYVKLPGGISPVTDAIYHQYYMPVEVVRAPWLQLIGIYNSAWNHWCHHWRNLTLRDLWDLDFHPDVEAQIHALVCDGLPTTRTLHSGFTCLSKAFPIVRKIITFFSMTSRLSIPSCFGKAPSLIFAPKMLQQNDPKKRWKKLPMGNHQITGKSPNQSNKMA